METRSRISNAAVDSHSPLSSVAGLLQDKFKELLLSKEHLVQNIIGFILIIITVLIILYFLSVLLLPNRNCEQLNEWYSSPTQLANIPQTQSNEYLLRDFFIKSSWNSCLTGQQSHDFMGLCGLQNVIKQGCRFLDFQIFTINGQPVVAFTTSNGVHSKSTYNAISTYDIIRTIASQAFATGIVANANDPLILHFRFQTKIQNTLNILAEQIKRNLNSRILGRTYSRGYGGQNIGSVPIKNFLGKIIIIADSKSSTILEGSEFFEYVNAITGSPFLQMLDYDSVKNTQNMNLANENKQNMMIVTPDDINNPNFNLVSSYGAQICAFNFYNKDSQLDYAIQRFKSKRTAFILKPASLRFVPSTIVVPPVSPSSHSYGPRVTVTDFYEINF